MSSRFHNKYHRHNHHTSPTEDPRYPDSSHDPIASPDSPFLGPFVLYGSLSSYGSFPLNTSQNLSAPVTPGVFVAASATEIAIQTFGGINIDGAINATQGIVAANISFTGNVIQTYTTPVTATGEFLVITVNGQNKAIRLWNY